MTDTLAVALVALAGGAIAGVPAIILALAKFREMKSDIKEIKAATNGSLARMTAERDAALVELAEARQAAAKQEAEEQREKFATLSPTLKSPTLKVS